MDELAKQFARFDELREMVDKAVEHAWECGELGKIYGGMWELHVEYPATDEGGTKRPPFFWKIMLHCYLIGPGSHYSWTGKTFKDALDKCYEDVVAWCAEEMENE